MTSPDHQTASGTGFPAFEPNWAFFLDVDGTLLDLAARPEEVTVRPGLVRSLERLHEVTGGAVALISGRAIEDLDRLFAPLRMATAGLHGIERRDQRGRIHRHHKLDDKLDRAREKLTVFVEEHPGILLEDKQYSIAVHYRQAPEMESRIASLLREVMSGLKADFYLQQGKMVFEIRPGGRNKGMAIGEFMLEKPFKGKRAVFIGDDVTDEDGFAVVNRMNGYSVKVGDGDTSAGWSLPDTGAVIDVLNDYTGFMTARQQNQQ